MLQALLTVHNWSVLYPLHYWSIIFLLFLAFTQTCYVLGGMNAIAAISSSAPTPTRRRIVLHKRGWALLLQISHILILGSIEATGDAAAFTIAMKFT